MSILNRVNSIIGDDDSILNESSSKEIKSILITIVDTLDDLGINLDKKQQKILIKNIDKKLSTMEISF